VTAKVSVIGILISKYLGDKKMGISVWGIKAFLVQMRQSLQQRGENV